MEKYTFEIIQEFEISNSNLEAIDDVVFSHFLQIKKINLILTNLKSFFKKTNSTNWFISLRHSMWIYSYLGKQLLITFGDQTDISNVYEYPDNDFCKFIDFPHDKNVFVRIKKIQTDRFDNLFYCTCTFLWLLKNFQNYFDPSQINNTQVSHCLGSNFSKSLEQCHFERRDAECSPHRHLASTSDNSNNINPEYIEYTISTCTMIKITLIIIITVIILGISIFVFIYCTCCRNRNENVRDNNKESVRLSPNEVIKRENEIQT